MAKLVAVDNNHHKNIKIITKHAESHGANLHLIPAVLSEFTHLCVQYPIVITKNGDTGQFVFAAMLGFESGENLFWQNEQWQGIYLPLQIQRQPFFVGYNSADEASHNDEQSNEHPICIDLNSPSISETEGEPLFTDTGEESNYFQQAKQSLAQILQGELDNQELMTYLQNMDLLQPLALEITFVNQQSTRLNGLFTINTEKLARLPNQDIVTLHQAKLLQPIYTMVASLGQIYALIDKKNKRLESLK